MRRVNLWESTSFRNSPFWGSASKVFDDDGWLSVTQGDGDSYLAVNFKLEPSTEYVWSVEVETPNDALNASQVYTADWKWLAIIDTANGRGACRFTTPADGKILITMYGCGTGLARRFKDPLLELAETYDQAVAGGGLRFFAWNTMPRP